MKMLMANIFQWYGGPEITLMSIWHIMYIVLIIGLTIGVAFLIKNKSEKTKKIIMDTLAIAVIATYLADFFFMPLSRANDDPTRQLIDVEKLPFHLCTFIGVMIPFAQCNHRNGKIKNSFNEIVSALAITASFMYIILPGSAIGDIGTFSYKVVQTFTFHGLVFAWGVLSLTTGAVTLKFKNIWKPLVGILIIMAWATIGNFVYPNELYSVRGNWCFLMISFLPFIPDFLMPVAFLVSVFGICTIVYCIDLLVKTIIAKHKHSLEKATGETIETASNNTTETKPATATQKKTSTTKTSKVKPTASTKSTKQEAKKTTRSTTNKSTTKK